MQVQYLLIGIGLLLVAETIRSHRMLVESLRFRRRVRRPQRYPSVSVIRPVKGLDVGAAENIEAALDNGYPGPVETLFVFDNTREPALPLVRRAIDRRRARGERVAARVVFCGSPPKGRTGKLNAMIAGLGRARHELVAFADSDTRPDGDALRVLVETLLSDERSGSAFAPVVVSESPRTAGDAGYALLLNGLYGPLAAEVARRRDGELPFIMGQFMIFRRQAIEAIGGLQSADGQLVDDMHLGDSVSRAGYRNLVSPHPVAIIQYGLPFAEFLNIYVRWITFSRTGLPGRGFKIHAWLQGGVFFAGLLLAAVAHHLDVWPAAVLGLAASGALVASIVALHLRLGGGRLRPRFWLMPGLILLLAPWVLARVFSRRELIWRGRKYQLDAASRLEADQKSEAGLMDRRSG